MEHLRHEGRLDQITFEAASSKSHPNNGGYDLVTFFDCLNDTGDPAGAARNLRSP
jgi:hypothetical protein